MNRHNDITHRDTGLTLRLLIFPAIIIAIVLSAGCGRKSRDFTTVTLQGIQYNDNENTVEKPVEEDAAIHPRRLYAIKKGPRYHDRIHINPIGRLAEVFNDSNKYQLEAANRLGIRPITNLASAYYTSRPVCRINSCDYYTLDSLKHSLPYLVPEAERLLADIGRNFMDSLASRGADGYRIRVTSLLRTPSTVKRLRRVNRNAVDSSTHQYGTTFDISFVRFDCLDSTRTIHEEDLKNLLGEVLLDLRKDKRCLVKYERTGGCFHITTAR